MSGLLWYGIFVALLCLAGIIFAVLHIHRLIDVSRIHPREHSGITVDDDGIFTQLTPEQKDILFEEREKLALSGIPNARLRADLPPNQAPLVDEELIEEEWISEVRTERKEQGKYV